MSKVKSTSKFEMKIINAKGIDEQVVYGYARCSTNEDRQDITRQTRELTEKGCDVIYFEYGSGAKVNREGLNDLLGKLKKGDKVIALEVSRITRSTKQLMDILELMKQKECAIDLGVLQVDFGEKADPFVLSMIQLMGVFAELERNMAQQRILSGLKNAKAKGVKLGRKELTLEDLPRTFIKYYPRYVKGDLKVAEYARLCETSRTTIYRWINVYENNNE